MSTTTITGASDDLIEVDGMIHQEFTAADDGSNLLAFSDGTILEITYDEDGIWRVKRVASGTCEFSLTPGDVEADTFDVATLTGDLRWCVLGERNRDNPTFARRQAA